ncbi:MAG: hypothetical protein A3J27_13400 [Candidatus Tectomicrobia bacterium RIFCSPLOWO2_12_FULL_69_37]|nr:MAG: hypothetical protein A3J27_13400 [Candidatus Tectomicrobia bacterium RIFCSPLOWO2_12_FULL_69_37]OGL65446.1 MAG: hypothetical protein A3I72_03170 [Candidatus Tectomicrobia bacterium RIFCSPLOWO2_02_FULL_70_19]
MPRPIRALLRTGGLAIALLRAAPAWAHGGDEILLFTYLAEEANMLRLSAGFMGTALLLLGSYVALAGMREWGRLGKKEGAFKLMGPGGVIMGVGTAILLTAAFILPERLRPPHEHPEKPRAAEPAPSLPRRLGGPS